MSTTLDHLVWAGPDLDALVTRATDLLGLEPVAGGPHDGLGTRNYLVGLGAGQYLELVGPDPEQPEPARPRPFGIDDLTADRLLTWAVRTDDMAGTLVRARERGYDPGDAGAMSRTRPDGVALHWQLTQPHAGPGGLDMLAPFVIDWQGSPHPSDDLPGGVLDGVLLRHPEHARLTEICRALDITTPVSIEPGEPSVSITLTVGSTSITV